MEKNVYLNFQQLLYIELESTQIINSIIVKDGQFLCCVFDGVCKYIHARFDGIILNICSTSITECQILSLQVILGIGDKGEQNTEVITFDKEEENS